MRQGQAVTEATRFVGLDVHRRYATVAAVDSKQQVVLTARRLDFEDLDVWIRNHLRPTDVVTLEATSNAWHLYDQLVPVVASVTVANPIQVALIAKSHVKPIRATRSPWPACWQPGCCRACGCHRWRCASCGR